MTPANPFSLSAYGRRLLVLVGVVALALGAVWLAVRWDRRDTKAAGAEDAHLVALDSAIARLGRMQHVVDTQYLVQKTVYVHAGAKADTSHAASDADPTNAAKARQALADETDARRKCDLLVVAGERVSSVCKERADSLQAKIGVLESRHSPRFTPWADPGWNLTAHAPALVGGADYRLYRDRVSLRAFGQQTFAPGRTPEAFAVLHLTF